MAANDQTALMKLFKDVLLLTYGKKSDDGRLFLKNDAIRAEFEASPAFSAIYMELMSDAQKAANFKMCIRDSPDDPWIKYQYK